LRRCGQIRRRGGTFSLSRGVAIRDERIVVDDDVEMILIAPGFGPADETKEEVGCRSRAEAAYDADSPARGRHQDASVDW
jgi:hypothetical protein